VANLMSVRYRYSLDESRTLEMHFNDWQVTIYLSNADTSITKSAQYPITDSLNRVSWDVDPIGFASSIWLVDAVGDVPHQVDEIVIICAVKEVAKTR